MSDFRWCRYCESFHDLSDGIWTTVTSHARYTLMLHENRVHKILSQKMSQRKLQEQE